MEHKTYAVFTGGDNDTDWADGDCVGFLGCVSTDKPLRAVRDLACAAAQRAIERGAASGFLVELLAGQDADSAMAEAIQNDGLSLFFNGSPTQAAKVVSSASGDTEAVFFLVPFDRVRVWPPEPDRFLLGALQFSGAEVE